jgi:hypothetical protein
MCTASNYFLNISSHTCTACCAGATVDPDGTYCTCTNDMVTWNSTTNSCGCGSSEYLNGSTCTSCYGNSTPNALGTGCTCNNKNMTWYDNNSCMCTTPNSYLN